MPLNSKEKVTQNFMEGIEKFKDNRELLDFLESYYMFMIQGDGLRNLNKEDLSFTMSKLYGIIELRELLTSDRQQEVEEVEEKGNTIDSLLNRIKKIL